MKVNSSVLLTGHHPVPGWRTPQPELFWAQCGMLAKVAFLANDRTPEGVKYTQAGIDYTDSQLRELGFPNVWRFQHEGQEEIVEYAGKKYKCKPTVEVLMCWNGTDVIVSFRGTHDKNGWDINIWKAGHTTTDIGEVHQGWMEDMDFAYDPVLAKLMSISGIKSMRLWCCGHSKGSAESQLFAVSINRILPIEMWLGIGSPKPFSPVAAKYHNIFFKGKFFWTKNNNDIVCILPPIGYDECGQMLYISSSGNLSVGPGFFKQVIDGIVGFFKAAPNPFEGEYFDAGEDHFPHLYVNAFCKAAGDDSRYLRWKNEYM